MRMVLCSLFVIGLSISGLGQDTLNQMNDQGRRTGYWIIHSKDKPEKGYAEGGRIEEGPYKDGRKHGTWTKYHKNGKSPRLVGQYVNGRPNGNYTKYYENGNKRETGYFTDGKQKQVTYVWFECGVLASVKHFDEDGKKHGVYKGYYNTCDCDSTIVQLEFEVSYDHNFPVDTMKRYWPSGCPKLIHVYDSTGRATQYFQYEDNCENPPNPELKACYDTLYKKKESRFPPKDNYKKNGFNKIYNNNSDLWMEGMFKNGKLWDGRLYKYDSDGNLLEIERWRRGEECLTEPPQIHCYDTKVYDSETDEIWMDGEFRNGQLWEGRKYIYDDDGILIRIEIWKNGKYDSDGVL